MLEILIGAIGALLTAVGLGWQVWRTRRDRRPDVEVTVSYALLTGPTTAWTVWLEAVNHGIHPVRVTGVGFDVQDGSGYTIQLARMQPLVTLPGVVAPHDSGHTYLVADPDVGEVPVDLYRPLIGWVRLSNGERIRSKPVTLMKRSPSATGG